jgi:hypothetical protein
MVVEPCGKLAAGICLLIRQGVRAIIPWRPYIRSQYDDRLRRFGLKWTSWIRAF